MLWFTVWTLLIVGSLVGAFFLLRSVYRSGRALLAELERAADLLTRLAERSSELAGTSPAPVELMDPGPARARLDQARLARLRRRARRMQRHQVAYRRWQAFTR